MNEENSFDPSLFPAPLIPDFTDDDQQYSRGDLLELIAEQVSELMDRKPDLLFSTLYRIDVAESRIEEVLSGKTEETIPEGLARLILDRQIEKMKTRAQFY